MVYLEGEAGRIGGSHIGLSGPQNASGGGRKFGGNISPSATPPQECHWSVLVFSPLTCIHCMLQILPLILDASRMHHMCTRVHRDFFKKCIFKMQRDAEF